MMGPLTSEQEQPLFSYQIHLEKRVRSNHPLRQLAGILDLSFVAPAVRHLYGRSGNISTDPEVIVKMMLLLFYYNVASERELVEQIRERLDFLWFLGYDLESEIPHHSVLSKARARWGTELFERLFIRTVEQCVKAGLVDGRLLHVDSTTLKANASKDSVVKSCPELVSALRKAYQEQERKLELMSAPPVEVCPAKEPDPPSAAAAAVESLAATALAEPNSRTTPDRRKKREGARKLKVNENHISLTDPEAQVARFKNGLSELSYKEHRAVDDAHGVITAVQTTASVVADGTQLPVLIEQHLSHSDLKLAQVTVAGDHHYGTASNYLFCNEQAIRAHLAPASANVQERGQIPVDQFIYEPDQDRLRCPAGHYLDLHQNKPKEQLKVYLIKDPALCAQCPLRERCTDSARGRSVNRHVQAPEIEKARAQAQSPQGRYSRKRRKHVMEGSFADAANNHRAKRSRWRGLRRQKIQSWLICAVQNLRQLMRNMAARSPKGVASLATLDLGAVAILSLAALAQWLGNCPRLGSLFSARQPMTFECVPT